MNALEKRREHFEGFMRAHGAKIYTLSIRLTGDPVEGGKLAEVTFLTAYANIEKLKDESRIGEWFYRACISAWKVKLSKTKQQYSRFHISSTISRKEGVPEDEIPGLDATLLPVAENEDRQHAVKLALDQLGPEERALVIFRDIENKSYEEVAALLDIPLDTVKARLSIVREHLRQILLPIIPKPV